MEYLALEADVFARYYRLAVGQQFNTPQGISHIFKHATGIGVKCCRRHGPRKLSAINGEEHAVYLFDIRAYESVFCIARAVAGGGAAKRINAVDLLYLGIERGLTTP